ICAYLLVKQVERKPKLAIITVTPTPDIELFIKNKKKAIEKIGAEIEIIHYKRAPRFEKFVHRIKEISMDSAVSGVVIQKPLPAALQTVTLYNYINPYKEIEGVIEKSPFLPPLGKAVVTALLHALSQGEPLPSKKQYIDEITDMDPLKLYCRRKKVVVVGRGETGGVPIAKTLSQIKVPFINIFNSTVNKDSFLEEADIIITAVGKNIIDPEKMKKGIWLISTGYRNDKGIWKGDFEEDDIQEIADFYTPTPGGMGPLDIAYLMQNLVRSAEHIEENNF
ncbi:MAG: tetrahydrofolate dehydrogenase/cyclohydrolase catalytic domain-containing protein, partial [Candidatus Roizmanbacteria bacterium]